MWKEKTIFLLVALLIVAVAILSYLFFETYTEIKKEKQTDTNIESNVPAGTEIPLNKIGENPLPVTIDPTGVQIPLEAEKPSTEGNKEQNKLKPELSDTSQWKTYTNKKYGYSFKYPKEYDYSNCDETNPCKYGQVYEKDGGDAAWLNGVTNDQGWPYIIVVHYDNESYTLPSKTKFFDWLQQKMGWTKDNAPKDFNSSILTAKGDPKKAMRVSVPQTPQAHAREEIYFEENGKIFQIQFMDSNNTSAQEFYNNWLKTFSLE